MTRYPGSICDVPGILVGQVSDREGMTGTTVVLCRQGAVPGADVRGAAPGTRETDLTRPENTVDRMHAVCLSGGSAFGLDAAGGVMRALAQQEIGFDAGPARVPIVGGAVVFDLGVGSAQAYPTADFGYQAVLTANDRVLQGAHGAGTGATCGKAVPGAAPHRGGVGTASVKLPSGAIVGALIVVNACGDIYDPQTGALVAAGTVQGVQTPCMQALLEGFGAAAKPGQNTTIGVIATNAALDKAGANRLATIAHDGLALAIRPVHTCMDGDTLFALATGQVQEHPAVLLAAAVTAVWHAVLNAVTQDD
jgi:L-aminopeptidase/D-esterase-like protein